ncbi:hypothetical protein Suden_0604 [Sulfurimonas denitrificans DSM 1251]|uniref:Uncharacterized protein n=1 Tax=Sulfurimonas denitrificans (strain ATCC 33889 / DSM 1251) TaxID=326298 RepID=Q30SZ8_SULDN|nr:hypothetical protein [Sulfurimonas denitrificans]ABB43883.1 hypothetical protein Suden_0604 [Sulfurimonas denitrificans DSM 1251]
MKNLFVARSPLQVINAIEAVKHFKLTNNTLVLIYNRSTANTKQMRFLLSLLEWEEVIHIEDGYGSKILKYVNLIKKLRKERFNYIFVGELGVSYKMIIANIKKEKVFLMDDGTATIVYYNTFIKQDRYNKYNFKELRFLLFGLKIKIRDKINLFTYFDLAPVHGNEVIKNNLAYFKRKYLSNAIKENDIVYFIGQPADIFMDIDVYKKDIEALIKKFNKKIVYIPHRLEVYKQQEAINSIESDLFEVKKLDVPIELYFLQSDVYPMHIVSYYSTALVTLKFLFDMCINEYIIVPKNSINEKRYEGIESCYSIFKESGMHQLQI